MSLSCLSSAERRARDILDAYGSRPENWPAAERQATLHCIARSPALQAHQQQLAELDERIQTEQVAAMPRQVEVDALQQRILEALPAQRTTGNTRISNTNRVWQRLKAWCFSPPFTVALTGVAVIAIVMLWPHTQPSTRTEQAASQYDAWSWYDITGQDLSAPTTHSTLSMTDWIELPFNNEDGG